MWIVVTHRDYPSCSDSCPRDRLYAVFRQNWVMYVTVPAWRTPISTFVCHCGDLSLTPAIGRGRVDPFDPGLVPA